jgi:hypothetical protein
MKRFTQEHLQLAWNMKMLGIDWRLEPGAYVYAPKPEASAGLETPFQPGVHLVIWPDRFMRAVGGAEALDREFCWLPLWEEGRDWLRGIGAPDKHLLAVVREGVRFYGEDERTLLYQEMIRFLEIERALRLKAREKNA